MTRADAIIEHVHAILDALQEAIIQCKEYPAAPELVDDLSRIARCRARKDEQIRLAINAGLLAEFVTRR